MSNFEHVFIESIITLIITFQEPSHKIPELLRALTFYDHLSFIQNQSNKQKPHKK